MNEPIPVRVTRYRCPHCNRSHSARVRCVEHIARCWRNPEVRGCKTCRHFGAPTPDDFDDCAVGVDLTGRPACEGCGGWGWAPTNHGGEKRCGPDVSRSHVGDGREVKPGPIVGCDKWEAR